MGGGGHRSTDSLVNEPTEGWQGVPLRCFLAPDTSTQHTGFCLKQTLFIPMMIHWL